MNDNDDPEMTIQRFEDLASKMFSFTEEQIENVKERAEELASGTKSEEPSGPEE